MPDRPGDPRPVRTPAARGEATTVRGEKKTELLPAAQHFTDQDAIRELFALTAQREVHPIASETFIERSKGNYGRPWLAREIIQNFVDHGEKGTLNDVRFSETELESGFVRFAVAGGWPFADPSALLSPDSGKEEGPSAGGNGIGLKQVALLLFRDHGVRRFDVYGEGWKMPYEYHTAKQLQTMQSQHYASKGQSPAKEIKKGWLMGSTETHSNAGQCGYVIETDNPELIATLRGLKELGVSRDNPHLQHAHYEDERGIIKWLPLDQAALTDSRMFVNGQVMQFKEKGPDEAHYWTGPEHAVVAFKDVTYNMTIDRPAMSTYEFERHFERLVQGMTIEQIIAQLQESRYLWTHYGPQSADYQTKQKGCLLMINKLVEQTQHWNRKEKYDPKNFVTDFPGKLLALDQNIAPQMKEDLEAQGYTLCPAIFAKIGMERVSAVVDHSSRALNEKPNGGTVRYERGKQAQTSGVEIYYEPVEATTPDTLFAALRKVAGDNIESVTLTPDNRVRIVFPEGLWSEDILIHNLPNSKKDEHKLMRTIRGVIKTGLEQKLFVDDHVLLQTEKSAFVYNTAQDTTTEETQLFVKKVDLGNSSFAPAVTVTLECRLQPAVAKRVEAILTSPITETTEATTATPEDVAVSNQLAPEATTAANEADSVDEEDWEDEDDTDEESTDSGIVPSENRVIVERADTLPNTRRESSYWGTIGRAATLIAALGGGGGYGIYKAHESGILDNLIQDIRVTYQTAPSEGAETEPQNETVEQHIKQIRDPELDSMLKQLESLHKANAQRQAELSPGQMYDQWRSTNDSHAAILQHSGYITGRGVSDILSEYTKADIPAGSMRFQAQGTYQGRVRKQLERIANDFGGSEHTVENFELVTQPTETELARLALLRSYVIAATGIQIHNDMFLFEGNGTAGINIGNKAIGIHRNLLSVEFDEALSTVVHELAHNVGDQHDEAWQNAEAAVWAAIHDKLTEMNQDLRQRRRLDSAEQAMLNAEQQWNALQQASQ